MTSTPVAERFDYTFIYNAIKWAEQDEAWLAALSEDERNWWGTWSQSHWGGLAHRVIEKFNLNRSFIEDTDLLAEFQDEIRSGKCGTSYCQAGQKVHQMGYRLVFEDGDRYAFKCVMQEASDQMDKFGKPVMVDVEGASPVSIEDTAAEAMGLTYNERAAYFYEHNTVEHLKCFANGMCQTRGIPLMWPDEDVCDANTRDVYAFREDH